MEKLTKYLIVNIIFIYLVIEGDLGPDCVKLFNPVSAWGKVYLCKICVENFPSFYIIPWKERLCAIFVCLIVFNIKNICFWILFVEILLNTILIYFLVIVLCWLFICFWIFFGRFYDVRNMSFLLSSLVSWNKFSHGLLLSSFILSWYLFWLPSFSFEILISFSLFFPLTEPNNRSLWI